MRSKHSDQEKCLERIFLNNLMLLWQGYLTLQSLSPQKLSPIFIAQKFPLGKKGDWRDVGVFLYGDSEKDCLPTQLLDRWPQFLDIVHLSATQKTPNQ